MFDSILDPRAVANPVDTKPAPTVRSRQAVVVVVVVHVCACGTEPEPAKESESERMREYPTACLTCASALPSLASTAASAVWLSSAPADDSCS